MIERLPVASPSPAASRRPLPPRERLLRAQSQADRLQDPLEIRRDVAVPEAQDTKTLTLEPSVALEIVLTVGVVQTIGFNNQIAFETHKVHNEPTDGLLAVEFHAQLCGTQAIPQQIFCRSLSLPQRPRSRCQHAHRPKLPLPTPSLSPRGRGRREAAGEGASPATPLSPQSPRD